MKVEFKSSPVDVVITISEFEARELHETLCYVPAVAYRYGRDSAILELRKKLFDRLQERH